MNVETLSKQLTDVAVVEKYGKGFVVRTSFCATATGEPVVVGILEEAKDRLLLTDFGFVAEFLQKNKKDLDEVFPIVTKIAGKYDAEWLDDELFCYCDTKDAADNFANMVKAMLEIEALE